MRKRYKNILIVLLIILAIYALFQVTVLRDLIGIIIISFVIAYALRPLHRRIEALGLRKNLSAVLLILALVSLFLVIFIILIPGMFKESLTISKTLLQFKDFADGINKDIAVIGNNKTINDILNRLYDKINNMFLVFFERSFERILSFGEHILSIAVIPVVVYYFLSENTRISNRILLFIPVESRSVVRKIAGDIDKVLSRYIVSQFFLSFLIGSLTFFILILLKVEYPLLLSLLNALFNIIPYFGPLFGALPAVLMALLRSPQTAVWTAICLYGIQQIEGDIISPKITGDSVNIHPLVVIFLLLLGGKLGGFLGMVLAVPIGVMIKVIYEDLDYYMF
jgi:predicted PurR-regulated permease PerM